MIEDWLIHYIRKVFNVVNFFTVTFALVLWDAWTGDDEHTGILEIYRRELWDHK